MYSLQLRRLFRTIENVQRQRGGDGSKMKKADPM